MNTIVAYIIFTLLLIVTELGYFHLADKYNIIDKPTQRGSHTHTVLRGGGIIFPLASIAHVCLFGNLQPWFLLGLVLISIISFWDDIHSLPDSVRLIVQAIAILLLCFQYSIGAAFVWWIIPLALFVGVGISNVFNFMDGINGMMAGYSLIVLLSLLSINTQTPFIDQSFILTTIIADIIFCFFNFRPRGKAKCFAGDIGAVSMAYIIMFIIGKLILHTEDITWLILLVLFGVDACLTILHRIQLRENLGQAHRKHLYQLMANELHISHPLVSGIYMLIQALISSVFIFLIPNTVVAHWVFLLCIVILLTIIYWLFMKKYYPLHKAYLQSIRASNIDKN